MPTAAAERAAKAEKERLRANDTTVTKKPPEAQKTAQNPVTDYGEPFPADSIFAAAVNQKEGFSVVEAEGRTRNKTVIVEHVTVDGIPIHRLKLTTYSFFRSRDAAIEAAHKQNIKLLLF